MRIAVYLIERTHGWSYGNMTPEATRAGAGVSYQKLYHHNTLSTVLMVLEKILQR